MVDQPESRTLTSKEAAVLVFVLLSGINACIGAVAGSVLVGMPVGLVIGALSGAGVIVAGLVIPASAFLILVLASQILGRLGPARLMGEALSGLTQGLTRAFLS